MNKLYQIKIYGASDDLVELSGYINDEFSSYEKPTYLLFNDGTQLKIEYGHDGEWIISRESGGLANYQWEMSPDVCPLREEGHTPSPRHDGKIAPSYSDLVTLTWDKPLKLVKRGHRKFKPVEQNDGVDKVQCVIDYLKSRGDFDDWWHDIDSDSQNEIMEDLTKILISPLPSKKKTLCFTGTLSISRVGAQKMSKMAGFDIINNVTSGIDYVVVGQDAGSKRDKAKELGIPILDETKWRELIGVS